MTAEITTSEMPFSRTLDEPISLESSSAEGEQAFGAMVSLHAVKTGVWRRRRVWLVTALLGMLMGASLHFVIPPKYAATTEVYLGWPPSSDPTESMANAVALLQTRAVAEQAVSASHLRLSANALLSQYHGFSLSDAIMSITANGASEHAAVSEANAVAKALLTVLTDQFKFETTTVVEGIQSQIASLNRALNSLNTSINNLSTTSTNAANNRLTELIDQRGNDANQISQLQSQVFEAQLGARAAERVSHVLNPAEIETLSGKKAVAKDALAGLAAGLGVGVAGLVLFLVLSDRPRDRATVAAMVGAPVELSLKRFRSPRLLRRRRLAHQLDHPSSALRMIERRLKSHLESASGSALGVIAVGAPEASALAIGALALSLSADDLRVVLVDTAEGRPLASLFGLSTRPRGREDVRLVNFGGRTLRLLVGPDDPAQIAEKAPPEDADAVLVLASLDPAFGAGYLRSWITDAVIMVAGGEADSEQMMVAGEMLRHTGITTRSVILVGADPRDESSGAIGGGAGHDRQMQVTGVFEPAKW